MLDFLTTFQSLILKTHFLGFILGFGGALVSDFLFFRFLRDMKISKSEKEILEYISKMIWLGVLVLFVTGILLFIPNSVRLLSSASFIVKMTLVAIILLNATVLNFYVSPRLLKLGVAASSKNMRLRRIAFACGAISMITWYSTLFVAVTKGFGYSLLSMLVAYGIVLAVAIFVSQLVAHKLYSK